MSAFSLLISQGVGSHSQLDIQNEPLLTVNSPIWQLNRLVASVSHVIPNTFFGLGARPVSYYACLTDGCFQAHLPGCLRSRIPRLQLKLIAWGP